VIPFSSLLRLRLARSVLVATAVGPLSAGQVATALQSSNPAPATVSTSASLDAHLERTRAALFGRGAQTLVETSGTVELATGPTPFRWIFAPDGSFLFDTKGRFAASLRSTGETVWRTDLSGPTWRAGGLEGERALVLSWVWSGAWAKERGPLELTLVPDAPEGSVLLTLALPGGALRGELELEAESGLPTELRLGPDYGAERFRFSAWRVAGELHLPGRVELLEADGTTRAFVVESARPWTRHAPAFDRPERTVQSFNRADFRRGADPSVPATIDAKGALLVDALINDLPARLELDPSCGPSEIERGVADVLRLSRSRGGKRLAFDVEAEAGTVLRASGRALVVGPFARSFPMFREIDTLEDWTAQSRAGRLGWGVFSRAVVEIDLAAPKVALHSPVDWELPPEQEVDWSEVAFHWTVPHVRVERSDGSALWLRLVGTGTPSVVYEESLSLREPQEASADEADSDPTASTLVVGVAGREVDLHLAPAPAQTLHRYTHGELSIDALGEHLIVDFPGARIGVPQVD